MHRLKLQPRVGDRREVIRVLAAMDDAEFRAVADEARGASLVPLAELVIEGIAATVQDLLDQCGDLVVIDDVGRRCVTRDTARTLLARETEAIHGYR